MDDYGGMGHDTWRDVNLRALRSQEKALDGVSAVLAGGDEVAN
jgi:hypothetical protein